MENFILIFCLMILGKILVNVEAFPRDSAKALNLYVAHVALPALILLKVPQLAFSRHLLVPVLMPWLMLALAALLTLTLAKIFRWDRSTTGALLLLTPLGNTAFLGIPMVQTFFGNDRVPFAVLYDQFGSFFALSTYGTVILATYGSAERPTMRGIIKKICLFPPFIALVAALLTKPLARPPELDAMLALTAGSLVPVVMTAVGFQLQLRLSRAQVVPLGMGLLIKLVGAPLIALTGCALFQLDSTAAEVAVFEAGMPPMIMAGALAVAGGLAPELSAAMVGIGIVASFATLPLLYRLIEFFL